MKNILILSQNQNIHHAKKIIYFFENKRLIRITKTIDSNTVDNGFSIHNNNFSLTLYPTKEGVI